MFKVDAPEEASFAVESVDGFFELLILVKSAVQLELSASRS
jgi:hypothetical protein